MIYLAGIEDSEYKRDKIDYWDDVYGMNMRCIKNLALSEPLIDTTQPEVVISTTSKIFEINLYTVIKEDLDFSAGYELTFTKNETCNAIVSWFDVIFDKLPHKVTLSTSPFNEPTHWKQVVFYPDKDFHVSKGDKLKGSIAAIKDESNFRLINIKMSFHYEQYEPWYQLYKIT